MKSFLLGFILSVFAVQALAQAPTVSVSCVVEDRGGHVIAMSRVDLQNGERKAVAQIDQLTYAVGFSASKQDSGKYWGELTLSVLNAGSVVGESQSPIGRRLGKWYSQKGDDLGNGREFHCTTNTDSEWAE
jgi:hypothetical protein